MNKWIILEIVIAVLLHIYCNSKIHGEHNYIIAHLNLAVIPYSQCYCPYITGEKAQPQRYLICT